MYNYITFFFFLLKTLVRELVPPRSLMESTKGECFILVYLRGNSNLVYRVQRKRAFWSLNLGYSKLQLVNS